MLKVILGLVVILVACPVARAEQQVPVQSLESLQEILWMVRDKLWEKNEEYWHRGEHERCIATMRLITQIDPHDVEAYDNAAWLMQSALRDEEAEAFLLQGLANNRGRYDLYFDLGYFCYMHERFDEAVAYLNTAVCFECPKLVWHTLAHSAEQTGDIAWTLNIWLQMESLDPADPVPQLQISRILSGGQPSSVPRTVSRAREERRKQGDK